MRDGGERNNDSKSKETEAFRKYKDTCFRLGDCFLAKFSQSVAAPRAQQVCRVRNGALIFGPARVRLTDCAIANNKHRITENCRARDREPLITRCALRSSKGSRDFRRHEEGKRAISLSTISVSVLLQITLLVASLWILRGDASAAKNGLSKSIVTPFWETLLTITVHTLELLLEQ